MQVPENIYKIVPGLYLVMGLALLYFAGEAMVFHEALVIQGLLIASSFLLIFAALRVMRLRKDGRKTDE